MSFVLKNAKLVLSEEIVDGSVNVDDGIIRSISSGDHSAGEDCEGDYLMPGIVELHTDNLERHIVPRPAAIWPNMFASVVTHDAEVACSGITTVFDSLRLGAIQGEQLPHAKLFPKMLSALAEAVDSGMLRAHHLLHLRLELTDPGLMDLLSNHADFPLLKLISLMDHTPGQRQWQDIDALRRHSSRGIRSAEEVETMIQLRIEAGNQHVPQNRRAVLSYLKNRELTLASHDDTTLEHIEEAVADKVSISEFPCSLEAASAAKKAGMFTLGGAPNVVRGGSHSGNVNMHELLDRALLDGLSSDYVPASLLQAVFQLVEQKQWSLPEATKLVTANTASMVGLTDRGVIAEGKRADLIRVRLVNGCPCVRSVYVSGHRVA
ncbi:MAG: alpha-D-ribose 1-methylphosphonate 5-triphosphate diphosphatase [Gammaproteobacteria bacterium]|nr:alpha-D-ribose 1-methylphosphonate 5-triphosphate diphosphatase [Gammaproteobacteria bacterium]